MRLLDRFARPVAACVVMLGCAALFGLTGCQRPTASDTLRTPASRDFAEPTTAARPMSERSSDGDFIWRAGAVLDERFEGTTDERSRLVPTVSRQVRNRNQVVDKRTGKTTGEDYTQVVVTHQLYQGDVELPTRSTCVFDEATGELLGYTAKYIPVKIGIVPKITRDQALATAIESSGMPADRAEDPQLVVWDHPDGSQDLFWFVVVRPLEGALGGPSVFYVDALTGAVND